MKLKLRGSGEGAALPVMSSLGDYYPSSFSLRQSLYASLSVSLLRISLCYVIIVSPSMIRCVRGPIVCSGRKGRLN